MRRLPLPFPTLTLGPASRDRETHATAVPARDGKVRAYRRAAGIAILAALTACRPAPDTDAARPLELLVSADAENLDPRYVTDATGMRVSRLVHAGLVRLDPDSLAPIPYVASGWTWRDASTLEVTLREGLRFHGGAPLTSADVVATIEAFRSKAVGSRHAGVVEAIGDVRAEGPLSVTIRLRRPHATLLTDLELPILRADQATGPPDTRGTLDGLGPYEIRSVARGEVALVPAPSSVLPSPHHAVLVRTIHDENARALRLLAGRADVALNVISPALLPALTASPQESGLSEVARPGANLTYMLVRMGHPPLADLRVRRAVSLSIDRAGIAATLLAGHAQPADSVLPSGHWAETPMPRWTFDPEGARRELSAAGVPHPHLSLLTSTDRLRLSVARYLAQELSLVGFEVEITSLELGTLLARLSAGDFDLATLQLPELTEPNVLRVFLHSAAIPPAGSNRGRVEDPVLDALLDEGDRTTDLDRRRGIYAQVDARIREELLLIPLWHEDQVALTSARARGFVPSREGRWLSLASVP